MWSRLIQIAAQAGQEGAGSSEQAEAALNELCRIYWYPIYAYARSCNNSHEESEDLTQLFFQYLVENQLVARADRNMTKFRTFLLTHFKYVISNQWRLKQALKRGGHLEHLSFDFENADERFQSALADGKDPALIYDQAWANTVIERILDLLKEEYLKNNSDVPFERLQGYLPGGSAFERLPYEELERLYPPVKKQALMTRVSRLNKRFRELLVATIADTVADPAEVEGELKHLVQVLTAQ